MKKIVSADHHFIGADGVYRFDPSKIGLAHQACFRAFLGALIDRERHGLTTTVAIMSGVPGSGKSFNAERRNEDLVVDNTNLHAWEISPYLLAAESFGATVKIVRVLCDPDKALARQGHGVPAKSHARMAQDFNARDVMPWWPVEEIQG